MPEGPSIVIAKEAIQVFEGKKILDASGTAKIAMGPLINKKLVAVRSWGKHLLLCLEGLTIRVHFLMFGSYMINDKKERSSHLTLDFGKGNQLNIYTSSIKLLEQPLDEIYDWSADLLSDQWDPALARKKLKKTPDVLVTDALLNQDIFAGSGNIIKNEVLHRIMVHPYSKIGDLPPRKLTELVKEVHNYSHDFLEWKKAGILKRNWLAYTKKKCSRDGSVIKKEYLGEGKRRTFYCEGCQVLY
ncbi:MAG: endonuclease [Chitinophagaceae bacterium]|nr:endonuclease [Chitinophagaceae bacterium]